MSVITTRTSLLSILKVATDSKSSSSHKVRFQLPSNVRQIFLNKKNRTNTKEYENLVCTIRDSDITDKDLKNLLEEAKNCTALLDYDLRLFVQALVILGWTHRAPDVVQVYSDFIMSVLSAHPLHSQDVINQFIKLFTNCDEWNEGSPAEVEETRFAHIHGILKIIIRTIPLTSDMVIAALRKNFPYYTTNPNKQQAYMYNTLKILEYMPNQRREILLLYVDRLLNLDVNAPKEDIETQVEECFPMDDMGFSPIADALDAGMSLLFRYIDHTCRSSSGDLKWIETKALFSDFLVVLDKNLLCTYGSEHVQFLLFYFVSLKPVLAQGLLNSLWQKVITPVTPEIVRKMSVYYMASFLTRANFIPSGFLKTYLTEMVNWAHRYIQTQESTENPNLEVEAHGVFYAVCQAVFYIIAFCHRDLVDSKKKLAFLQSLNLTKIVTCRLNPLRVCIPPVVEKFAAIARDHQLAYCYTIIESNARCFLKQPLQEALFPFDPFVLKKSSKYITPLYREYVEDDPPKTDKCEMDEEQEVKENAEEDEFIVDHSPPKQGLTSSLGTSPGFKQMSL